MARHLLADGRVVGGVGRLAGAGGGVGLVRVLRALVAAAAIILLPRALDRPLVGVLRAPVSQKRAGEGCDVV